MKEIVADNNRKIRIYDDVFDHAYRQYVYTFVTNSMFRIGWADGNIIENKQYQFLHSVYSAEDMEQLGFLSRLQDTALAHEVVGHRLKHAVVNLSTPADVNFVHTHPEDKVVLYYVNMEWRDGWHGETLFYSENMKDVVFASPYTPGRICVFDAKIPHTIRPQSHIASFFRFTFALVYEKC